MVKGNKRTANDNMRNLLHSVEAGRLLPPSSSAMTASGGLTSSAVDCTDDQGPSYDQQSNFTQPTGTGARPTLLRNIFKIQETHGQECTAVKVHCAPLASTGIFDRFSVKHFSPLWRC